MFSLAISLALAWQDPASNPPKPTPVPAAAPAAAPSAASVRTWDDKTTKAAIDEFTKVMKGTPSMLEKSRALDQLAGGSNVQLLKPLADVVEKDKSIVVRKRAAELIVNQPEKEANATLRALLKNPKVMATPQVCAQIVRGIANCGYEGKQWPEIEPLFERSYTTDCLSLHDAILDLATKHAERAALPLLLRNLDEPAPRDEHAADNPPKEYWEARWKAWSAWKARVKNALFAITGQRFNTVAEAEAWLKNNPK